jgi:hypothetical protein
MAGPWLYPISAGGDRSFTLAGGESIPVTVDSYRTLLENGRIVEDRYWYISGGECRSIKEVKRTVEENRA